MFINRSVKSNQETTGTYSGKKVSEAYLNPVTSKMEIFVTLINGFQLLTNVPKNSILDVAEVLDMPLRVL